jgi:hypothetical protein
MEERGKYFLFSIPRLLRFPIQSVVTWVKSKHSIILLFYYGPSITHILQMRKLRLRYWCWHTNFRMYRIRNVAWKGVHKYLVVLLVCRSLVELMVHSWSSKEFFSPDGSLYLGSLHHLVVIMGTAPLISPRTLVHKAWFIRLGFSLSVEVYQVF